ncbi:MAG: alpha/beta hydrolase [Lachnospiraceae bacterium]|nr:alpha/beta hydrolase [Lachnospiraceae bacterium]
MKFRKYSSANAAFICFLVFVLMLCGCNAAPLADNGSHKTAKRAGDEKMSSGYTVKELTFARDGKKVYGKLYMPDTAPPFATVILTHGFGANLHMVEGYSKALAESGYAAYAFDFIGGGNNIESDGKTTEMSVLTEAEDLNAVIDGIRASEFADPDNIILLGASMGGFVATYTAAKRQDIKALIALYPAYVLQDDSRRRTDDGKNIQDRFNTMGVELGRIFDEDALSFDIYEVMAAYGGRTLIIHGTADSVVPVSYSEKAAEVLPDASLVKIEGADHVFFGKDDEFATELILDFMKEVVDGK